MVLDPDQGNFGGGGGDTPMQLNTRFLESEGDEFNSPVTSRDPKEEEGGKFLQNTPREWVSTEYLPNTESPDANSQQ